MASICPAPLTTAIRRRTLLKTAALGATASVFPLSGCGGGSGVASIRFESTKPETIPYFDGLIATFNKSQSGVRATHDSTSSLIASFVRGNPPDLDCDNYNITTSIFLSRGVLSDLAGLPEAKVIDPNVQGLVGQYATYKGQVNVLPYSVAAAGVIYNVEMFDKYGLSVPKTWSELISICEKLKAKNVNPIYGTYKDPWTIQQGLFDYVSGGMIDVFPLLGPMNATVGIFAFLLSWNDFMMPSLITANPAHQTLPVIQNLFQQQFATNYNVAFASYLMAMAPSLIGYLVAQRWVMSGVMRGAIK